MADDARGVVAQPLLPAPARLASHMAANRQRLLDLFGGLDDIGWGRRARENGGIRWAVRDLLAYFVAGASDALQELDRVLTGQAAVRPAYGSRRARLAQQQVDLRTMIPVTTLLADYTATSEQLIARVRALTSEQAGVRWTVANPPAVVAMGYVPATHWLGTMLGEVALRAALEASPLEQRVSTEEAHDVLAAVLGMLPLRLPVSHGARGEFVFRCSGPGRGSWTLRSSATGITVAPGSAADPDVRVDGPWLPLLLLLTQGRLALTGPLHISGPHPWQSLALWRALRLGQF